MASQRAAPECESGCLGDPRSNPHPVKWHFSRLGEPRSAFEAAGRRFEPCRAYHYLRSENVVFDPLVEAIRSALRTIDANPRIVSNYLNLIEAYENCASKEAEPELLDQAAYVIRDVKKLAMTEEEKARLAELETRIAATLTRILPASPPR